MHVQQCRILASAIVLIGLSILSADAREADAQHWSADCHLNGRDFRVNFDSPSGDPDQDDMRVSLVLPDQRELLLPLLPGTYRRRSVVANQPSLCDGVGAFQVADRVFKGVEPYLLLWLSVDNRPGWDTLSLALIDLGHGKVLHSAEGVAPIKDPDGRQGLAVQVSPEGFQVRLERQWLHNTGTDSAENSIEDWLEIWVRHGRIQRRWRQ
jgi:hypothetical protein